ncbi:MAG: PorT family protein [Bacteroidia bacterium]|nr:PorT family protein [Bacteroidia bacterium]
MKTIKLLALTSLLFSGVAVAQQGLHLSARIMPQGTMIINDDDMAADDRLNYVAPNFGFAFGFTAGYHFNDNLGAEIGVMYSGQKQKYKGEDRTATSTTNSEWTTSLNYIKIPIAFTFNSNPDANVMFHGFIGPQIGILAGGRMEGTETTKVGTVSTEVSQSAEGTTVKYGSQQLDLNGKIFNSTDFGIAFGLGPTFKLGDNLQLSASLRFDYSFSDHENKESAYTNPAVVPNKFWENYRKGTYNKDNASAASRNATVGLMIGVTYVIGQ